MNLSFYMCLCIAIMGFIVGDWAATSIIEDRAVEHQCAQYNSVTGDFGWREL